MTRQKEMVTSAVTTYYMYGIHLEVGERGKSAGGVTVVTQLAPRGSTHREGDAAGEQPSEGGGALLALAARRDALAHRAVHLQHARAGTRCI